MDIAIMAAIAAIVISVTSIGVTLVIYSNLSSDLGVIVSDLKEQSDQIKLLDSKLNSTQATIENQKSDITQMKIQTSNTESELVKQRGNYIALNQTLHNLNFTTLEYSAGSVVTLAPGQQGLSKARCNPGEIATGGGFDSSDASIIVVHDGIATEQGWDVIAKNTGNSEQKYYAFAICAKLSP